MALKDLIDPALVDAIGRSNLMLVFTVPVAKPDIYGIVKGQPVGLWIMLDHIDPFSKKTGRDLTAPTL
jgi:hypothetical protein